MKTRFKLSLTILLLATGLGAGFVAAQSTSGVAQPPLAAGRGAGGGAGLRRGGPGDGQPRMDAALLSLQEAKRFLENAAPDKGGFREKAIKNVEEAIADTKAGIDYAKAHPEEYGARGERGLRGLRGAQSGGASARAGGSS